MSVTDYTTKIKEICDALGSINVMVDEDEMVQSYLGGLTQRCEPIRTTIYTREKPSASFDLQSMLMVEENHAGVSRSTQSNYRMLYMEADRPPGHGERGGSARNGGGRQEHNPRHNRHADSSSKPSTSRGSEGHDRMLVLWLKMP